MPIFTEPTRPRNLILGLVPKSPVAVVMVKPGTAPCKPRATSVIGLDSNILGSIVATAPVRLAFF
ncbi:hypothetical protein D3C72_1131090 [compost metagenome]